MLEAEQDDLRSWHQQLAALHGLSVLLMLLVGGSGNIAVRLGTDELFAYPILGATISYSTISSFTHLLVAGPLFPRHLDDVRVGHGRLRWTEYSISATLMVVVLAGLAGITNVLALSAIAIANVAMIQLGSLMERTNPVGTDDVDWRPFVAGCIVGAIPWVAIAGQVLTGEPVSSAIIAILFVTFFAFSVFAVIQFLQYRPGRTLGSYLQVERAYLWASLAAKVTLAWTTYFAVLR